MTDDRAVDLHQHLWPEQLVDRLRARSRPPYLRGWRLHTAGEPPYDVDPVHHAPDPRAAADRDAGVGLACVSLSAPLGIESLEDADARDLLEAWHVGARTLPAHFAAWASVTEREPDLDGLAGLLDSGFVGVQLPATALATPGDWERAGAVLRVAERAGRPVLVHPGPQPVASATSALPAWWAPVVGYVGQMQAAWWGWHAAHGRALFPQLRLVFAAGAGLAPVHHERHAARGGPAWRVDPHLFVDTSSYGPRGVDALMRVLGIDPLVLGSDRPYGAPRDELLGDAATHAIRVTNPRRALGTVEHQTSDREGGDAWRRAS
ncbi:MAG: amidohydrolase family protein [Nocardioidaceae bacterium]